VLSVNAAGTIMLLMAIEVTCPGQRFDPRVLGHARHHRARLVQQWLPRPAAFHPVILPASRPDRRIAGVDAPALNPEQRLCQVQGFQWFDTDRST
jgi:hypothetical protein